MTTDDPLTLVARDQRRWSLTANGLKASIGQARRMVLSLAIAGAALETWGAQIHSTQVGLALALGYAGAAVLAISAVIRQWRLGHERTQAWIVARSGAESFKREMYLFRTGTGPYASGNAADSLLNRRDEIPKFCRNCSLFRNIAWNRIRRVGLPVCWTPKATSKSVSMVREDKSNSSAIGQISTRVLNTS
jgi:hypothetical protein